MRATAAIPAFLAALLLGAGAQAASPVGVWMTKGGESHIRIERCGGKLCGRIVWLKEPKDKKGRPKTDHRNPNALLRNRRIIDLVILTGLVQSKVRASVWRDGRIYSPRHGRSYDFRVTLLKPNTLRVRGYIGISLFGGSQVWKRVR